MSVKTNTRKNEVVYASRLSVEGGFGYIVFVAVTIIAITISLPLGVFGIIFGKFLAQFGDETTGTSLANNIFNTTYSLTGLVANVLLNKCSCRIVGLLGGLFCVVGCGSLFFVHNLITFIVFFGVVQGFGYGLLLPASLSALNNFFDKRLSLMMSMSQALMVACCMLMPPGATFVMETWGFRGALLCLNIITLLNIPAAACLSKFEYKKSHTILESNHKLKLEDSHGTNDIPVRSQSNLDISREHSIEPLLNRHNSIDVTNNKYLTILHIADRATSIASIHRDIRYKDISGDAESRKSIWKSVISSLDFSLLKSPKYLNISVGLSFSYISDICFITILPVVLGNLGFSNSEIALNMSIFFGSDLVSRILLSIVSSMTHIKSRYLVFGGSVLSVIFRCTFVWYESHLGKIVSLAILGFLRCFIQTPLALVISDEYPNQFASAFSLFMVVCGLFSLVFGPLMGLVKSITSSDTMVCHLLTSCYVICIISWLCEMGFTINQRKKSARNLTEADSKV